MFILSLCSVLNLNQLSIITNVYEHMFILSSCSVLNRLDVLKVVSEKSLKIPTEQSVIGKRTIKKRQTMIYITLHISNNDGYLIYIYMVRADRHFWLLLHGGVAH